MSDCHKNAFRASRDSRQLGFCPKLTFQSSSIEKSFCEETSFISSFRCLFRSLPSPLRHIWADLRVELTIGGVGRSKRCIGAWSKLSLRGDKKRFSISNDHSQGRKRHLRLELPPKPGSDGHDGWTTDRSRRWSRPRDRLMIHDAAEKPTGDPFGVKSFNISLAIYFLHFLRA